eukprot:gene28940-37964_t
MLIWCKIFAYVIAVVDVVITAIKYKTHILGEPNKPVDLTGKVYIVTGCNTGIGFETAKQLAKMNGTVVMACRSIEKANNAKEAIMKEVNCSTAKLIVLKLDLCGFDSVRKFVKAFQNLGLPLHCLINNAGIMNNDRQLTQKTNGRVVNLSSSLHHAASTINFDDIMSAKNYSMFPVYGQSKLANILFTRELQKRLSLRGSKVVCNSVHPGCVRTEVARAYTTLHVATSPRLGNDSDRPSMTGNSNMHFTDITEREGEPLDYVPEKILVEGGLHYFNSQPIEVSEAAKKSETAIRLWMVSEQLTGLAH